MLDTRPGFRWKTIVWDVDDVLNDLTAIWFDQAWLKEHPDSPIREVDLLSQNPPHSVLGVTMEDYLGSLDRFRSSPDGRSMLPRSDVLQWFEEHGPAFRHVALTSAPASAAPESAAWVVKHFGRWIRAFCFVPSPRVDDLPPRYDRSKGEFLKWWKRADYFIDDRAENVIEAETLGLTALLMPRPWNDGTEDPLSQLATVASEIGRESI